MAKDVDNVLGGPADVEIDDTAIGHTQGGVSATIAPQNRPVNVDQFGSGECNIRHTGDEVRCTIPFAEWAAADVVHVYAAGNDSTSGSSGAYLGIGRSSGFIYTPKKVELIPLLTADAAKKLLFHRAAPIGDTEIMFNSDDDRIFNTEWACLVDESQTDGELIGQIFLN